MYDILFHYLKVQWPLNLYLIIIVLIQLGLISCQEIRDPNQFDYSDLFLFNALLLVYIKFFFNCFPILLKLTQWSNYIFWKEKAFFLVLFCTLMNKLNDLIAPWFIVPWSINIKYFSRGEGLSGLHKKLGEKRLEGLPISQ